MCTRSQNPVACGARAWLSFETPATVRHIRLLSCSRCVEQLHSSPHLSTAKARMCLAHLPHHKASASIKSEWDSLITEFFRSGQPLQAVSVYHQMQQQNALFPSPFSLVCLLKSCAQLKDHLLGRMLHAHIARMSFLDSDPFLASALIDMYAKCGFLPQAQQVFDKLLIRDVVCWTTLIAAYVEHGYGDIAIYHLEDMKKHGVCPDHVTYICGLKSCGNIGATDKGQELHAEATMKGLETDLILCSTLVDMYAKCGSLWSAQVVYDKLTSPNQFACTALIVGYTNHGFAHEALQCFKQMQIKQIPADAVTYVCSLQACGSIGAINEGYKLHSQIIKEGMEADFPVCNTLIDMYAKSGAVSEAHLVLIKLPSRNVVSWNALIAGYVEHEYGVQAICCFKCMQGEGITPDDATLSCTLKACGITQNVQEGQEIHSELIRRGLAIGTPVGNALVDMYAKCGLLGKAKEVFKRLEVHDVVTWTALITGYAEYRNYEEALYSFYEMQHEGVSPDATTFVCTLKACIGLAALDTGQEIHAEIVKAKIKLDSVIGSSLVSLYAQCGWVEKADEVFYKLTFHNVTLYNALLAGYAQLGEVEKLFCTFGTMITKGLQPDVATFASLFNVCSYGGLLHEALIHLECMSKIFSVIPTCTHYNCFVDLLCRINTIDMALAFIQVMPFHPCAVVWHDVLGACQRCSNVELGLGAFDHAFGLNEKDSTVYISMLNIFSMEKYV